MFEIVILEKYKVIFLCLSSLLISVKTDLLEQLDQVLLSDWLEKLKLNDVVILAAATTLGDQSIIFTAQASLGQLFKTYDVWE